MTRPRARLVMLLWSTCVPCVTIAQGASSDSAALVATTQKLLDAITSGDSSVWASHLSERWFITDEEGRHHTRREFLPELRGLPPGQSGRLEVGSAHFTHSPGVAVLSYDIEEWHDYHGQELRTRFHATDTWVIEAGEWKMLASQVTALPTAVQGRSLDRKLLDEYVGTYSLTDDIELRIVTTDSGLELVRAGRSAERLHALDERLFIRHGVRGFWLFERDANGKVTRLVSWRDNNPISWKRRPGN